MSNRASFGQARAVLERMEEAGWDYAEGEVQTFLQHWGLIQEITNRIHEGKIDPGKLQRSIMPWDRIDELGPVRLDPPGHFSSFAWLTSVFSSRVRINPDLLDNWPNKANTVPVMDLPCSRCTYEVLTRRFWDSGPTPHELRTSMFENHLVANPALFFKWLARKQPTGFVAPASRFFLLPNEDKDCYRPNAESKDIYGYSFRYTSGHCNEPGKPESYTLDLQAITEARNWGADKTFVAFRQI